MQIPRISNNINFTKLLSNKTLLKGLEKISEHGTSFSAGVSLIMPLTVRPMAIMSTPDVEMENKLYACANSIGSGLIKFALVEAVALPIENAVKKIDQNPAKYLKKSTIKNLGLPNTKLTEAKSYKLAAQIIKLGTGLVTAIPKSMLTIAVIPIIMDTMLTFTKAKKNLTEPKEPRLSIKVSDNLSFKAGLHERLTRSTAKIFDIKAFQNFVRKYQSKEKDIAIHMTAGTDILLTGSFAHQTQKSKNIKENRKKALIYNNVISTAITLAVGYSLDSVAKTKSAGFLKKFSQINKNDPKLHKYIEGINIARPALIFAAIYYGILPMFSTYLAEKVDKYIEKQHHK